MCNCKGSFPLSLTLRLRAMEFAVALVSHPDSNGGIPQTFDAAYDRVYRKLLGTLGEVDLDGVAPTADLTPAQRQEKLYVSVNTVAMISMIRGRLADCPRPMAYEAGKLGLGFEMTEKQITDWIRTGTYDRNEASA